MAAGRKRELTDEQREQNRKNIDSIPIPFNVPNHFKLKIDSFATSFKSRNAAILHLIKTHPEFLKQFPKK